MDGTSAALAVGASLAVGVISAAVYRTVAAASASARTRHATARQRVADREPAAAEADATLAAHFEARKDEVAAALADALRCATVSYDRPGEGAGGGAVKRPLCASLMHVHGPGSVECTNGTSASPGHSPAAGAGAVGEAQMDAKRAAAAAEFLKLHALLRTRYPRLHDTLRLTYINTYSVVGVWQGSDDSLQATALYAHMDVVPADDAAEWSHPPFAGDIADGCVWGRGAIDDKQAVITICEAVEYLVSAGFKPRRTVVLMFGHDEEIGGEEGAAHIARWIQENIIIRTPAGQPPVKPLAFLLDEGLFLLENALPGVTKRTAMVCTAEKGIVNVELSVDTNGGHASAPGKESAIGILSNALTKLERTPFPAKLAGGPVEEMFNAVLPYLSFPYRFLFANLWLTRPLVTAVLTAKPSSATMVRTTTALTIFQAGSKANTLPPSARAVVNHRVLPSETVASVLERDRRVIQDERVHLRQLPGATDPSPVSDSNAPAFHAIASSVEATFVDVVALPALMVGATDSHWSEDIAVNMYRHCPTELHVSQVGMFHGRNERITVDNLARMATFYARLIQECDAREL